MVMKGQFLRQDSFERYHAAVFDGFSLEGCMKKEERVQRMKRRLIGLEGPLDEAQWHEVDRVLSGTAAYTFSMTSLLLQLSLIWDAYSHQRVTVSFGTMALFVLLMGQSLFAWWGIRGNKALRQPPLSADEHSERLRTLKKQSILSGAGWGVTMLVLMHGVLPWAAGMPLRMNAVFIVIWLVGGAFFGGMMYLIGRRKLGQAQAG